jgi:hypothetical protein
MELAVLLAAGLRDWIDLGVIIGILMLNAIVGWYQEKQAADVVASLKGDIAMRAWVIRDGSEQEILGEYFSLRQLFGITNHQLPQPVNSSSVISSFSKKVPSSLLMSA